MTDPVRFLDTAWMVAAAIDDSIVGPLGFGLSDVLEVVLRHLDDITVTLSPAWPEYAGGRDDPCAPDEWIGGRVARIAASPAVVTPDELDAARAEPVAMPTWIARCESAERAERAFRWLTRPTLAARLDYSMGGAVLGPVLALETEAGPHLVPAAFGLSAAAAAMATLAATASRIDRGVHLHLATLTRLRATGLLGAGRPEATDDYSIPPGALAESVIALRGRRHVVVAELVAAADTKTLRRRLTTARRRLMATDGAAVAARTGSTSSDADVVRVVIYGGPAQVAFRGGGPVTHLHLSEFEALISDAVQEEDIDSVWQFFEDLAGAPKLGIGAADILDAWRSWSRYGAFDPLCTGELVIIDPTPTGARWEESARWERVESVLTEARLGARSTWSRAALERRDVASLRRGQSLALVTADPPIVLFADQNDSLRAVGLDPALPVVVASGIRGTLAERAELRAHARHVGRVVIGTLEIDPTEFEPPEGSNEDGIPVVVAIHPSDPVFRIGLGLRWVMALLNEPDNAHAALGMALGHVLLELRREPNVTWDSDALTQAFVDAWTDSPPVALLRMYSDIVVDTTPRRLPRNAATRVRADRLLAEHVRAADVPPGLYKDRAAFELCQNHLTAAGHAALDAAVKDWAPSSARVVLGALSAAHADREARQRGLRFALASPWADESREEALDAEQDALATRPLELLVEWLLMYPPTGHRTPDDLDLPVVVALAELVLTMGIVRAGAARALHGAEIIVAPSGVTRIRPEVNDGAGIDLNRFLQFSRAHPLRVGQPLDDTEVPEFPPTSLGGEAPFLALTREDMPPRLERIDALLHRDIGTGMNGLIASLATAAALDADDDGIVSVNSRALSTSAAEWSGLPLDTIEAAISHLTLTGPALRQEGLHYWETERRAHRVMAKPFVENPDTGELLVAPACVRATQKVLGDAFLDGRLPWPKGTMSKDLLDALANYRILGARELERDASAIVSALGLPHRTRLRQQEALRHGLTIPGEIDLVVADKMRRIWICEVKDLGRTVSPAAIRARVRDYEGEHMKKLQAKVAAVAGSLPTVASLLNVDATVCWQVRGLFVTRLVEPAAFAVPPGALFVTIDDLATLLETAVVPLAGHFEIGHRIR
jgi:hypothetical protein